MTAIEKDADLPAVLADTLSPWADRFTLISADALDAGRTDGDVPRVAAVNKQNNGSLTGGFLCVGASSRSPVNHGSRASGSSPLHIVSRLWSVSYAAPMRVLLPGHGCPRLPR